MSSETLARATEPFFTTKGVGKGTGLGLSMVHGMAEQMGGRLTLSSRSGQGTTAEIWLPAVEGGTASGVQPAKITSPAAASGKLKVLAVDDDRLVLFNTTAMLEDLGHEVVEAGSGEEALTLLEKSGFDMLITDQAMPRMTGLQLLDVVRERWPGLPVILATGYAEIPGGTQVKCAQARQALHGAGAGAGAGCGAAPVGGRNGARRRGATGAGGPTTLRRSRGILHAAIGGGGIKLARHFQILRHQRRCAGLVQFSQLELRHGMMGGGGGLQQRQSRAKSGGPASPFSSMSARSAWAVGSPAWAARRRSSSACLGSFSTPWPLRSIMPRLRMAATSS